MCPSCRNVAQAYGVHPATIDGREHRALTRYDEGMKSLVLLAFALGGCSTDTFVGGDGATGDAAQGDAQGDGGNTCTTTAVACPKTADCNSFDNGQVLAPFGDLSLNGGTISFESDTSVTCPQAIVASIPQATAAS